MTALLTNPHAALAAFNLEQYGATEADQRATLLRLANLNTPLSDAMLIAALPCAANDTEREDVIRQLQPVSREPFFARQCRRCGAYDQPGVQRVWLEIDLCDCGS